MGDRGNIVVLAATTTDPDPEAAPLYLYTHWGGFELATVVQRALSQAPDRWQDDSYLARVIFCAMLTDGVTDPDAVLGVVRGTTGFGISTYIGDNDAGNPYFVVDVPEQLCYEVASDDPRLEGRVILTNQAWREADRLSEMTFTEAAKP